MKSCFSNVDTIDKADAGEFHVILVNGDILGLVYGDVPFLTVKGLLKYQPDNRYVTVDMGAVKYIYNGADVMAPGIVNADCDITKGDLIWVRDEKNLQPLAVGRALMSGKEMVLLSEGKAVRSIHHVGDDIWNYSSEH